MRETVLGSLDSGEPDPVEYTSYEIFDLMDDDDRVIT